jgi:stage II sporulation protein M
MNYRRWLVTAILLFGIGIMLGLVTLPSIPNITFEDIAALEELAGLLASLPQPLVAVIIFIKNSSALLISFVLSPILCFAPILALIVNGWLLSFISATVVQEESFLFLLAGLLPHGIFELPALILAQAAALSFGTTVMLVIFKRERGNLLLPNLKQNLRYLMLAFTLLLPAAIIETYVTPLLLT